MCPNQYIDYYEAQRGGAMNDIRVFRGGFQRGAGLGDVLRGLFRTIAPVAMQGIGNFAKSTMEGAQKGMPLGAAAKAALMPTMASMGGQFMPMAARFMNTVLPTMLPGDVPPDADEPAMKSCGVLFQGVDGVPDTSPGYKKAPKRSTGKHSHSKKSTKKAAVHYNF